MNDSMTNRALIFIEDRVLNAINRPITAFGLPAPDRSQLEQQNHLIERELAYDPDQLVTLIDNRLGNLTEEQRSVYQKVMASVDNSSGHCLFLDAPGISLC